MEIPLTREAINANVPNLPGYFTILQSVPYHRYRGETRILMLGQSEKGGLRKTLKNLLRPVFIPSRLLTLLGCPEQAVTVSWVVCEWASAHLAFGEVMSSFCGAHWEPPLLQAPGISLRELNWRMFPRKETTSRGI